MGSDGPAATLMRKAVDARTDMELFAIAENLMERVRGRQIEANRIIKLCQSAQKKCLSDYDGPCIALIGRTV